MLHNLVVYRVLYKYPAFHDMQDNCLTACASLSWPLHWFSALPVTLIWCLECHVGLVLGCHVSLVLGCHVDLVSWLLHWFALCNAGTICHIQEGKRGGLGLAWVRG